MQPGGRVYVYSSKTQFALAQTGRPGADCVWALKSGDVTADEYPTLSPRPLEQERRRLFGMTANHFNLGSDRARLLDGCFRRGDINDDGHSDIIVVAP